MSIKKVAVIGAGSAGLCVARHLAATEPKIFQTTIYEETNVIGGTWNYEDDDPLGLVDLKTIQNTDNSFHTSMYKSLRTNLPKQVMAFPDFPFEKSLPSFLEHKYVLNYIEDYAKYFDLYKLIRFGTKVINVTPHQNDQKRFIKWQITVQDTSDKKVMSEVFDAVIVCNGHFTVPDIPDIPGLSSSFAGVVTHSHWYKKPDQYQGKKVVVLGAASSGRDIAIEIASVADKVILSHKNPPVPTELPSNIYEKLPIKKINDLGCVVFEDDSTFQAENIMICTGYLYDFPFLAPECKIKNQNKRVFPLYKHLFNITYPSMVFLGLGKVVCPFPLFHIQAHYAATILSGKKELPSKSEMEADTENEFKEKLECGLPEKHFHTFGGRMWEYFRTLSNLSGGNPVPDVVEKLYEEVKYHRNTNLLHYRDANYEVLNDDEFEELEPKLKRKDQQTLNSEGFY